MGTILTRGGLPLCSATRFDPDRKALIDPQEQFRPISPASPEICVHGLFRPTLWRSAWSATAGSRLPTVPFCTGRVPIYRVVIDGTEVALSMPHVGGPAASAFIEEVWPRGGKYFVFFGAAGVLDRNIPL